MSPAPYAPRIDQLRHLRDRIDAEIRAEEQRLGRIDRARQTAFPAARSRPAVEPERPAPNVVREWAREQGIPVGVTGRIPRSLYHAYAVAHPTANPA